MEQELISPAQIRAARALVAMSQIALGEAAGLSSMTIKRAERSSGAAVSRDTIAAIREALEKAGVQFIAENGGGAGVRLRKG